jgi:NTE family protein
VAAAVQSGRVSTDRALVLGGGGVAGIAWETGVLFGLAEAGVDVTGADLVVGTSAGSTVGAQLGSGLPLAQLWARQAEPSLQNPELASPGFSLAEWMDAIARLAERHPDPRQLRRAIGAMALATSTVVEEARRAVIQNRLPHHDWPLWDLRIVAVDAGTGDPVVFDRGAGVGLVDAVTASCAVPGVWPPATVNGIRYVDGGIRTMSNADLAAGHRRVLVLAPLDEPAVHQQLAGLARAELIQPDEKSLAAFGTDPLDPSTRTPAAEAGRAQGAAEAARVLTLWPD